MARHLVIGSRGSKLALAQARLIQEQLHSANPEVTLTIEVIKTTGDVKTDPLSVIGGKGVFTKELEDALHDSRIDIAVHSLKDLPTVLPAELHLASICARENPHDALVVPLASSESPVNIGTLRKNAVVGTSSPRRSAQLRHARPDIVIRDLRGNIDTRLRKLDEGEYDALILAAAGLHRLGLKHRISSVISPGQMLPAVGQGAIGLETRQQDQLAIDMCIKVDHLATHLACIAERALLRSLGGGCQLPIAGYAVVSGEEITIDGLVADRAGTTLVRGNLSGPSKRAEQLGAELGQRLLDRGAKRLLDTH